MLSVKFLYDMFNIDDYTVISTKKICDTFVSVRSVVFKCSLLCVPMGICALCVIPTFVLIVLSAIRCIWIRQVSNICAWKSWNSRVMCCVCISVILCVFVFCGMCGFSTCLNVISTWNTSYLNMIYTLRCLFKNVSNED